MKELGIIGHGILIAVRIDGNEHHLRHAVWPHAHAHFADRRFQIAQGEGAHIRTGQKAEHDQRPLALQIVRAQRFTHVVG